MVGQGLTASKGGMDGEPLLLAATLCGMARGCQTLRGYLVFKNTQELLHVTCAVLFRLFISTGLNYQYRAEQGASWCLCAAHN